jgi:cytochrome c oxidase cbb3-type subunit I
MASLQARLGVVSGGQCDRHVVVDFVTGTILGRSCHYAKLWQVGSRAFECSTVWLDKFPTDCLVILYLSSSAAWCALGLLRMVDVARLWCYFMALWQQWWEIFLDWKDGALVALLLAQVILWLVLMISWWRGDRRIWHGCGLLMMALVPVAMKVATSPDTYPPIDQTTGGPTGASLLGSTLSVVALLLLVPHSLGWKPQHTVLKTWLVWALQFLAFAALEWYGGSHFTMQQIIGLALLLPWLVWIPRYWNQFAWPSESLWWRRACVFWWGLLVVSGWVEFLPGILDRMKFTNGLVGHAHWAMAGFTSSFVCMLMVILGGSMAGRIFNSGALLWNLCALLMGGVLVICGWIEGASYEWMNDTPFWRWSLMFARAACGMGLLLVAARWSWLWNQSNKS